MRILLLGEYSNVHATLAEGLRCLGHQVTVASNGDFWKDYPRDVSLTRPSGRLGGLRLAARLARLLPTFRGYDIVQLINPMFVELKAERIFSLYNYLRRHNRRIVLCALGMDRYWVEACTTQRPLRYSDFNIGSELRTNTDALRERREWLATPKAALNELIARDCDAIAAGLYEYWVCYSLYYPSKTTFIPLPIHMPPREPACEPVERRPLRIFIGINRERSEYKGTDIMLRAALDLLQERPGLFELRRAESLPFAEYQRLMDGSDAILDQLYSYTPSMNSLLAMSKGIVCIGGGEEEGYQILDEASLRPIVNVKPTYASVRAQIAWLAENPQRVAALKRQSVAYVRKHHDFLKVARSYESLYNDCLERNKR